MLGQTSDCSYLGSTAWNWLSWNLFGPKQCPQLHGDSTMMMDLFHMPTVKDTACKRISKDKTLIGSMHQAFNC